MKSDLLSQIRNKEVQLAKLKEHIDKSSICADLYNQMLLEKAILKKQLDDLQQNTLINKIKHIIPNKKEKLICDYFG